ncbi:hypothetical protein GS425_16995 [Rhodococcus hoagii]|nr:hypothetical protein [Prescottella equi]
MHEWDRLQISRPGWRGYLAGDPIRYPLYVGSMFLAMPLQLLVLITGHPF